MFINFFIFIFIFNKLVFTFLRQFKKKLMEAVISEVKTAYGSCYKRS